MTTPIPFAPVLLRAVAAIAADQIPNPLQATVWNLVAQERLTPVSARVPRVEVIPSDRRRDEFLAMLAHELRNPLEPIRSAAALLAQLNVDGPVVAQKAVSIIQRQVLHLTRLVDDLLDVSRINYGKILLRPEAVRLEDVLDAAIDANCAVVEKRGLKLSRISLKGEVWVMGDSVRLTQVFSNLLHNAAKFSVTGGAIEITVCPIEHRKQVTISVRDEGIGIAPAFIDSVFDLFVQEHQTSTQDRGGLGIGLSVVRSFAELHGGTVTVSSAGVAKGSEFVVTLPTILAPLRLVAVSPQVRSRVVHRVLLVDDNRDAAESMQALLEMEGHTVALAFDGQSALDQVAGMKPDVVVLDIGLPDISGYELARRIRACPGSCAAMLVAMTGYSGEQNQQLSRDAGFDHHFVKPADPAILIEILSR